MATTLNQDNSITVVAYSLAEFAFELTDLGAKGYTASYENDKCPFGGISGSMFQAILVPRHGYYIDKEGNHVNVPNTPQESALKDDSSDVSSVGGTDVSETTSTVKTAHKRTATKKTT
jgi:hypothetical protein